MNNSGMINWVIWGIIWIVKFNYTRHYNELQRNNMLILHSKYSRNRLSRFF